MKMMMMMLLLVSPLVLLVHPANLHHSSSKRINQHKIIDEVERYNKSLPQESFVEDVSRLECKNQIFCKVHNILERHQNQTGSKHEESIVRNLKIFIDSEIKNCTEILKGMPQTTDIKKTIPALLKKLSDCIKKRNFSDSSP